MKRLPTLMTLVFLFLPAKPDQEYSVGDVTVSSSQTNSAESALTICLRCIRSLSSHHQVVGVVAQLVERPLCMRKVPSPSLGISTLFLFRLVLPAHLTERQNHDETSEKLCSITALNIFYCPNQCEFGVENWVFIYIQFDTIDAHTGADEKDGTSHGRVNKDRSTREELRQVRSL